MYPADLIEVAKKEQNENEAQLERENSSSDDLPASHQDEKNETTL